MSKGYLPVPRSFFEDYFSQKAVFEDPDAYIDLQQIACYKPTVRLINGKSINLTIGEIAASERYLRNRWGWSRTKVRNFKEKLIKNQQLNQRKDQGETILILSNYWNEQRHTEKKEPPKIPPKEPEKNHLKTKEEEGKKERNTYPTIEQALQLVGSTPYPLTEECVHIWHSDRESTDWLKPKGNTSLQIRDWRADLKSYAITYHSNRNLTPERQAQKQTQAQNQSAI